MIKSPSVIFRIDKKKDLKNIWKACNSKSSYDYDFSKSISKNIVDLCRDQEYEKIKDKLKNMLRKVHNSKIINEITISVNHSWKKIEKEYFRRMDIIMSHKLPNIKIKGYLTTISKCPYDPDKKEFMFNMFSSIPGILKIAGHEIMHLYFHQFYWKPVEKEIGYDKTADLKESLTVLLNLEFKDLWFVKDEGYPKHHELRKFIEEEWKKDKNMNNLIKKCVNYLIT